MSLSKEIAGRTLEECLLELSLETVWKIYSELFPDHETPKDFPKHHLVNRIRGYYAELREASSKRRGESGRLHRPRISPIARDTQLSWLDRAELNGFIMIEKSCHTCEYGVYENQEEADRAIRLTCGKMTGAKTDGEIADPKSYVCGLWTQGAMDSGR